MSPKGIEFLWKMHAATVIFEEDRVNVHILEAQSMIVKTSYIQLEN